MEIKVFIDSMKKQGEILLAETWKTSLILLKIVIPVSVVTKILTDMGVIKYIGLALGHVVQFAGLPGSMGVVWATAMLTNLYAAIVVFSSMLVYEHLTVAQVTVLATMMLVAHSLPIELGITRKAGIRLRFMLIFRAFFSLIFGILLNRIYLATGFLQTGFIAVWQPERIDPSWSAWAISQCKTILTVYAIILLLLVIVKLLNFLHITDMLGRVLRPVLHMMGISKDAAPVTIIGMTMGIGYGGGLIIHEARSGRLSKRDIFFSLSFMGLMHSMIEDTLLMIFLGGHISGVLFLRFIFAMIVIFFLVRLMRNMTDTSFNRYFFREETIR